MTFRTLQSVNDGDDYSRNHNSVYTELRERISDLEFPAFQKLVLLWLSRKELVRVHAFPRRSAQGRRSIGGADFIAFQPGVIPLALAVQIRYRQTAIQRQVVDEFRGFLLRRRFVSGMIVTNSRFSLPARQSAFTIPGPPVRLISVAQLAGSMVALGLGVKQTKSGTVVDDAFFQTLGALRMGSDTRVATVRRPDIGSDIAADIRPTTESTANSSTTLERLFYLSAGIALGLGLALVMIGGVLR